MEAHPRVVITVDGRAYHRCDSKWYDATNVGVSAVESIKLDAFVSQFPELVQAIVLEEGDDQLDRHARRLKSQGRPYAGAGPTKGWGHRWAHCWACHHPPDSKTDSECSACHWILCRCGACGCGYVWCTRAA